VVNKSASGSGETKLENWVSRVLIVGVAISLFLEGLGMMLLCLHSHSTAISWEPSASIHGRDFFTFLGQLVTGNRAVPLPLYLMILGIAILLLTPYIRAVMSVFYFASVKNVKYFIITLFVLAILTISLTIH
jgi:uncharacterized membrane protein